MPTIFSENGYRFSFYSYDLGEPMHVHVTKSGCEAKVWMQPLKLEQNDGFKSHEVGEILRLAEENRKQIERTWNERLRR